MLYRISNLEPHTKRILILSKPNGQVQELAQASEDYAEAVVPDTRRRGSVTMGLFWITMSIGVPIILEGFVWYQQGFNFNQVCLSAFAGSAVVFLYTTCSAYLGVITGKTYGVLSRTIFGASASKVVSVVWSGLFLTWYALFAALLAQELISILKIPCSDWFLAALLGIVMGVNNVFGFRGVVEFARFLAGPILIAISVTPACVMFAGHQHHMSYALPIISSSLIGMSIWGNEPDFWRFGKAGFVKTAIPIGVAVAVGQLLFPVTGWLVANYYKITDATLNAAALNTFSFGNIGWIAAFTIAAWYFANNDGNLYGAINGLENVLRFKRRHLLITAILLSSAAAAALSYCPSALDTISSFNAFVMPCVTFIMLFEFFIAQPLLGTDRFLDPSAESRINITALFSVVAGWITGILAAGVFPCCQILHTGVWPLYPWAVSFCVYGILRTIECRVGAPSHMNR
jgi:purine-cytosine permease-like protein